MKFSIITPSFNQGLYIEDTLKSVLVEQSACQVEHIVMDGGSTDDTVNILKHYANNYSNLFWVSEPDKGQSDAINKGIEHSSGDIIAYINSDDYYLPNSLTKVQKIFQEYPQVDFVYGDINMVKANGKTIRHIKSLKTSLWRHLYSFSFPQQSCFWRRSLITKVPPFNTQNCTCMDGEYFAHILTQPITLYRLSESLACFRLHQDSISGSGRLSCDYQTDKLRIEHDLMPHRKLPRSLHFTTGRLIKQIAIALRPPTEMFNL